MIYISFIFLFPSSELEGMYIYFYVLKISLLFDHNKIIFFRNLDKIFKNSKTPMIVENDKSHGSLTVRCGAIIFGIGNDYAHK